GDVVRNLEAGVAHGFDRSERDEIVDGEHRRRAILGREETAHTLEPAVRIRGRLRHERRVEWQARSLERRLVALTPLTRARDLVLLDDQADPAVAEPDQMLDEPLRAADAVADDRVAVDSGDRSVDQHEGDTEPGQPGQVRLRL